MKNNNEKASVYLHVLRRWWWLPVLLALVSGGVTYLGTRALLKPVYGAQFTMNITSHQGAPPQDQPYDATWVATDITSSSVLGFVANALKSQPVPPTRQGLTEAQYAAKVSQYNYNLKVYEAGRPPVRDLRALYRTSCVADQSDHWITCSTTSPFSASAAGVLNALTTAYIPRLTAESAQTWAQEIQHDDQQIAADNRKITQNTLSIDDLQKDPEKNASQISDLTNQNSSLSDSKTGLISDRADALSNQDDQREVLKVSSPASFLPDQVGPHSMRDALLGVVVGLGMAAALIVLLEFLDDSFRTSDEVASSTGLTLLGAVRRYEGPADEMGLVASRMPRTAIAEAYRVARANIQFMSVSGNLKILLITSARDGEGKTTTANNLATTFALAGQRVLLIDSDLRRPGLTKMMGLKDMPGLSTALVDPSVNVIQASDVVGLSVVPSGPIPPNPAELLGSQRMRDWIEEVARRYDVLVLDTPPILSVADTRVLSTLADGVVLVLDPNLTTRRMVKGARMAIENVGARVLGIILNRDTMRGEGYYYNYYYYERAYRDDALEPSRR